MAERCEIEFTSPSGIHVTGWMHIRLEPEREINGKLVAPFVVEGWHLKGSRAEVDNKEKEQME